LARRSDDNGVVRVYLCGRMALERRGRLVGEARLAGRQGRLLLGFLATRRERPCSRADLVDALWQADPPSAVDAALNALISKLRAALRGLASPPPHGIATDGGAYQFTLPAAWVDIEAARTSLDLAEGAFRRGELAPAWAAANVAAAIARQPFLVDEEAGWVVRERASLSRVLRRALIVLSNVSTMNHEHELGIHHAAEALAAEPFDEVACQTLMRAHASAGNRAEALRVYAQCRKTFRDELGAEPSPQTARVFLSILQSDDGVVSGSES
jgi:DNA-binding SARP family transcriptional activator